jgi:hypothetical protein
LTEATANPAANSAARARAIGFVTHEKRAAMNEHNKRRHGHIGGQDKVKDTAIRGIGITKVGETMGHFRSPKRFRIFRPLGSLND